MDKKPVVNTTAKKKPNVGDYFRGVRTEIKKVIWPSRKELFSYTAVVVLTCVTFALLFWGFDSAFLALLKAVLNISI
ncbi:MAG: preprotein translocase subunit SecE [Eubacteriales bacterium]|nr:preprotein translocase subunit SecE [Eubacteriales bacterium]MDD3349544.1 preprotein translocase subunit SecE [Eubacteriales bacterium]